MTVHSTQRCAAWGGRRWALPLLVLALFAAPAWAQDDARAVTLSSALESDPASASDASMQVSSNAWTGPRLLATQFGAGAAAAAISVPLTLWGASAVGGLSNDLIGAALPSLVMLLVLPPLAVTLTEFLVGQALGANPRLWSAFFVTMGTQLVAIVGGVLLGVWAGNPTHVALFTLGEAILLPTAATLMLGLSQQKASATVSSLGGASRQLPPMVSVPLLQGDF